jgi:hypothetical protein
LAAFDRRTSAAKATPFDARFVERALAAFDQKTSAQALHFSFYAASFFALLLQQRAKVGVEPARP